jgi:hypothetical protein
VNVRFLIVDFGCGIAEVVMSVIEQREAFWAGERPTQIPYTIYHTKVADAPGDPAWAGLFAQGLGLTYKRYAFRLETRDLEAFEEESTENGRRLRRVVKRTSEGRYQQSGSTTGLASIGLSQLKITKS